MKKFSALLKDNRFLIVLSFVLAIIIWLVISIIYSPQTERVISDVPIEISLSATGGSQAMSAFGNDTTAKVTVSGRKYIVEQLSADSFIVSANTDSVTKAGEYNLQLTAKKTSVLSDFEILSVSPGSVTAYLDIKREVKFDLGIDCVGASVETLNVKNENMLLEPEFMDDMSSVITVVGPESEVKQIASIKAVADVNQTLTESRQYTARIVMYDEANTVLYDSTSNSNILKYTTPSFTSTEIMANVRMRKTVPLKIDVKNGPSILPNMTIYEITGSDLASEQEVSSVGIKGAADVISGINEIVLDGTMDFSTISYDDLSSFSFRFTLPTISGVTYDEYTRVSNIYFVLDLNKTEFSSKSFDIPAENITVNSIPEGKTVTVRTALKGVSVIGPSSVVNKLDIGDIKVSINASDIIENGASTVIPSITVSSGTCWISGSYEVTAETS